MPLYLCLVVGFLSLGGVSVSRAVQRGPQTPRSISVTYAYSSVVFVNILVIDDVLGFLIQFLSEDP